MCGCGTVTYPDHRDNNIENTKSILQQPNYKMCLSEWQVGGAGELGNTGGGNLKQVVQFMLEHFMSTLNYQ